MIDIYKLDDFTTAYIECALWCTNDESDESGGEPLDDNYGIGDISQKALESIVEDCKDFQESNKELLEQAYELYTPSAWTPQSQAGHDFMLTRNGHGAGFWDRGIGEVGNKLTKACEPYGECYFYVGDDGKIYV